MTQKQLNLIRPVLYSAASVHHHVMQQELERGYARSAGFEAQRLVRAWHAIYAVLNMAWPMTDEVVNSPLEEGN